MPREVWIAVAVAIGALILGESFAPLRRRLDRARRRREEERVPDRIPSRDLEDVYGDVIHTPRDYSHLPKLPLRGKL